MATIRQSYIKRAYRPVAWLFLVVVLAVFGGALYAGSSRAVITITPLPRDLHDTFPLIIGPADDMTADLAGTIQIEQKSASVTATPSSEGAEVPAHAHGQVILHNETASAQPLAQGTRLQSSGGVIARTATRVDVPAHGTIEVEAVSDETGKPGELAPGRLTIIALRAANQEVIYGQVKDTFTGGTTRQSGVLSVESLTTASNDAKELVEKEIGHSQPGRFIAFEPDSVATDPEPDVVSESYQITVTMKVITVTYETKNLTDRLRKNLTAQLAHDEILSAVDPAKLLFEDQPRESQVRVTVKAAGKASLKTDSDLIQPSALAGRTRADIRDKLLNTKLVADVKVRLVPWWQRTVPSQPERVRVVLQSAS